MPQRCSRAKVQLRGLPPNSLTRKRSEVQILQRPPGSRCPVGATPRAHLGGQASPKVPLTCGRRIARFTRHGTGGLKDGPEKDAEAPHQLEADPPRDGGNHANGFGADAPVHSSHTLAESFRRSLCLHRAGRPDTDCSVGGDHDTPYRRQRHRRPSQQRGQYTGDQREREVHRLLLQGDEPRAPGTPTTRKTSSCTTV